jgi:23S rRNA (cytosine1962-C5)-methyltransferase
VQANIPILTPELWQDYELLDSGDFEKLERFGKYTVARPEPQAIWEKNLSNEEWDNLADAWFARDEFNPEKGRWSTKPGMKDLWWIDYQTPELDLTFKISLSSFKHVGLFPEQAANWDYIAQKLKAMKAEKPRVLNLFAYTGAASVAAKAMGAEVVHVDAIKQVISWARENMEASKQSDIRWVVEDAMKFVQREVRRGSKYNGIILDPPAYGRGPDGEKWLLEDHLLPLLKLCKELVNEEEHFFILNLYSLGFSALIINNLMEDTFKPQNEKEYGELYIQEKQGRKLPLGTYYRFSNV